MGIAEKQKINIVISGYYGFNNAGDEAILLSMLKSMQDSLPQAECIVLSGNPRNTELAYDVKSVHRFHLLEIIRVIEKCDIFISGGGSLLQDITSKRSLFYYLGLIFLAKLLGKPVMLYAQGVGPINNSFMKWLTGKIVTRVDFITVRDQESYEFLRLLGLKAEKMRITADAVFMLPKATLNDGKILLNRSGLSGDMDVVGVAIRSWGNDKYLGALVDALDVLADQGKQIYIIPFQYPTDVMVAKKLQKALRHPSKILDRVCSTEEMLSVIGNLSLLIGMRLHSLIFASVMKVPFVALEYDPKVKSYVKNLGVSSGGDVEELTTEKILLAVDGAKNHDFDLSKLRTMAVENNRLLGEVVERRLQLC